MARVELNIVALGDFKSVNAQIKALQDQVALLNKSVSSVGVNSNLTKQLNEANAAFKATLLSTGQFTLQTVKLKAETDKFGEALVNGKLKLTQYFQIIKAGTTNATAQMKALAMEQTKLQNSMVMSDPTKQGVMSVYTPTKINAMANATKIAANTQNLYNIAVDKGTQSLINWGKNTQWAGRQLTVGMTVPLTIFGSTATQVFQQVNDELVRLQKVYGTGLQQPTQAVLDNIKQQVLSLSKELASSMGIAVKDTAAMAADLAATGKQGNDLIVATREAMRLQKLGEMDTQSAMQTTISLQNVYKLNTNQLADAVNFLNAVENQTSTSLQDLATGIPKVGPIVQQLGGSFKDTAIMMVAMKEAGVPAAQSANAIKSALASLINPTKAAKDAFAAYNINLSSIATKTGGNPVQMIMMLQSALKGLQPLAQAQLIEKLFGKFQEARIQALITNLGALNSQTRQAFDLANATDAQLAGIASGELKTATESVTGRFRRAVETMKADLIPVGEKIMQVATSLLNFGNSIAKVFGGLPGPVKTVLGIVAAGVALSGPIIMFTGVLANFVGYLIKGLFSMKDLINGTKTFGQLFTPEIIASQNAAQLFSQKILEDEGAVALLNKSVRELTVSLEGMAAGMAAASGTGLAEKLLIAEAGLAGGKIPFRAPKMANGGIVPGSPSAGDVYPALLMGGESVIPTQQTRRYAPFIHAMINGTLPQHGDGLTPGGSSRPSSAFTQAEKVYGLMPGVRETQLGIIAKEIAAMRAAGMSISSKSEKEMMFGNISHVAPRAGGMPKDWNDYSKMYALTAPENQALNLLTRPNSKNNVAAFSKSMENAVTTMVNQGFNESDLRSAAKGILLGKQPIEKLELKLFQTALDDIDKRVTSGELKPGKNFGSRTLPWVKSASSITSARLAGELPMAERMRLDLNAASQSQPFANSPQFQPRIDLTGAPGSNARSSGSYTRTNNLILDRIKREEELAKELNVASESASPSKATKRAAKNMVDGVTEGIAQAKPAVKAAANSAMEEALLANAGGAEPMGLATETTPGLAATSRQGGRFAKFQAARMATRAKLSSRLPKMMTGKFGGLGMGLGLQLAQQFAGPMIDKLPGGSIANDAITGASYGAFLGPEGAAAGAAIGGIIGGISKLINAENIHKANAEATFKASADAINMFGGAVSGQNIQVINLDKALTPVIPKADTLKSQTKDFVTAVNAMKADSPMKLIFDQMKNADDKKATSIAEAFANTQVALGNMDPAKAQKMIDLYLAATGHSTATGKAPANVKSATEKLLSAQGTQLGGLNYFEQKTMAEDSLWLAQNRNQKGTPGYQRTQAEVAGLLKKQGTTALGGDLAKNIVSVGKSMLDSGTSLDSYKQKLSAIETKLKGNTQASGVFIDALLKSKLTTNTTADQVKKLNLPLADTINYFKLAELTGKNPSPLLTQLTTLKPGTAEFAKKLKEIADAVVTISGTKPKVDTTLHPDGSPLTAEEIAANRVTALQKQYKSLLNAENKRTTELEKQKALMDAQNTAAQDAINYATQQTDVQNQIRKAMAGGDYLQANLLRQQLAGNADKYNQTVISNKNQQMIDQGRELYAAAQEKIANGQSLTKAEVSALKGYSPKLGTYNVGSVNMPSAVQYGTAASMGTAAGAQPVVNMVFNDTGKFTQEQLQAIVDNAFKKNGITAKMSGTSSKVGG
jgi:TP901 family phage tail tape measure protein